MNLKFIRFYFTLQAKILHRKLDAFGFNPYIAYVLIVALYFILAIKLFQTTIYAPYIVAAIGLFYCVRNMSQQKFNQLNLLTNKRNVVYLKVIENFIFTTPFLVLLMFQKFYLISFFLLIAAFLFSLMTFKTSVKYVLPGLFKKHPYEFTIGIRKSFPGFLISYALAIISIYVGNFNLGLFSIILVYLIAMSFYNKPEDGYYVWIYKQSPKAFIQRKIKLSMRNTFLLALPNILLLLLFNITDAGYLFLVFTVANIYLLAVVVAKYASYPSDMNIVSSLLILISLTFPPILLLIIPYLYKKSINSLSNLLHD